MKHINPLIIITVLLAVTSTVTAQQISRSVTAAAGGSEVSGSIALDWTLGEISAETIEFENSILTVGFQQPTIQVTRIASDESQSTLFDVNVYPNPVSAQLTIEPKSEKDFEYEILVTDVTGRLVISDRAYVSDGAHMINVNALSSGTYFIKFFQINPAGNASEAVHAPSFQFIKIQ